MFRKRPTQYQATYCRPHSSMASEPNRARTFSPQEGRRGAVSVNKKCSGSKVPQKSQVDLTQTPECLLEPFNSRSDDRTTWGKNWSKSLDLRFSAPRSIPPRWWRIRLQALPALQSSAHPRTGRAPGHQPLSDAPICQGTLGGGGKEERFSWKKPLYKGWRCFSFWFDMRYF